MPTPTPRSAASPAPEAAKAAKPAAPADEAAALLRAAEAALAQHQYQEASDGYNEALKLDPQNERAREGLQRAAAGLERLRRAFVAEATSMQSRQAFSGDGPRLNGRLEFETVPGSPRPGEPYTVRVYLANGGKKTIRISALSAVTRSGESRSGGPLPPESAEIGGGKRALLLERSETWPEDVASWSLQVMVTTPDGESFTSRLVWK